MDEREPEIQLDRRGGLKSVGVHVARLTLPLAQRRGTATARLRLEWRRIVGPEIAGHSLPERLIGAPRSDKSNRTAPRRDGGTLRLRVDGPLALELQHLAPQLIERINSYFGYAAVARLQIVQGPLPRRPVPTPPARPPLDAAQARALQARLQPVGDAGLRSALERLGRAVLARR